MTKFEQWLMNTYARRLVMRHLEAPTLFKGVKPGQYARVLELGCGSGAGTEAIRKWFKPKELTATDLEMEPQEIWWRRDDDGFLRLPMDARNLHMLAPDHFDAVVSMGLLHHIADWPRVIAEVHRVLRPGGVWLCEEVLAGAHVWPVSWLCKPECYIDMHGLLWGMKQPGFDVTIKANWLNAFVFLEATKR